MTVEVPFKPYFERLSAFIEQQARYFEPEVREAALYVLGNRGKRMRPLLVFSSGWMPSDAVAEPLVRLGAIVEMLHIATLVHDDVLDGASLRHNRPTFHQRYGTAAAVLLGDVLVARLMELTLDFEDRDIVRCVARAVREICSGEITQTLRSPSNNPLTIDRYYRIIHLKTATLFEMCCRLGARVANYPNDFSQAAATFGRHLGVAYQILDDVMDCVGDEKSSGKTLGTDLKNGKATLPFLILSQKLASSNGVRVSDVQLHQSMLMESGPELLVQQGVFQDVEAHFQREITVAEAALDPFEGVPPRPHLRDVAALVRGQMTSVLKSPSIYAQRK